MSEIDTLTKAILDYINSRCEELIIYSNAEDYWWVHKGLESPGLYPYTQSPLAALLQFVEHQKSVIQQLSKQYQQSITPDVNGQIYRYINEHAKELELQTDGDSYWWNFRCLESDVLTDPFDNPLDTLLHFLELERETMDNLFEWHPSNQRSKITPKVEPELGIDSSDDEPFHPL